MSIVRPVFGTLKASFAQNIRDYPISDFINGGNSIDVIILRAGLRKSIKGGIEKINATRNAKIFPSVARFRVRYALTFENGCDIL